MSLGPLAIRVQTIETVPLAPVRKRALVVDDSETILHAICSLLEHHDRGGGGWPGRERHTGS